VNFVSLVVAAGLCFVFRLGAALVLAAAVHSQGPARCLADLGDPARGEAAEIALLAMGERAAPLLIDVLRETNADAAARRARESAALRVLGLLGREAAALGDDLAAVTVEGELWGAWMDARAALEPWARARAVSVPDPTGNTRRWVVSGWRLHSRRFDPNLVPAQLLERLAENRIFVREAIADLLGRSGEKAAVGPLCDALRARDREPAGADELRHNGFVVPVQDAFRFAAAEAVLRLVPDDPRAVVAWSGRALLHPHRSVRLQALASIARFAPDIEDSLPDLVAIARNGDDRLGVEAVKLIGMSRSRGAACIGELEALALSVGEAAQRSKTLVASLHAAGVAAAVAPPHAVPADEPLRAVVAALAERQDLVRWNAVIAAGMCAKPLLLERLRIEHASVPDAIVLAIAQVARSLPLPEREELRTVLRCRYGDTWKSPLAGSSILGAELPNDSDSVAGAELRIGDEASPSALAKLLGDDDPFMRLVAAQRLVASAALAAGQPLDVRDALVAAVRASHPKASNDPLLGGLRGRGLDVDSKIHAAAAAALVAFDLSADQRAEFLPLLRAGDDVEAIARGLRRWASARSLPALVDALGDQRSTVAIATAEAIASLGKDGAPAAEALRKLAACDRPEVAVAARAALKAVGE